MFSDAGSIPATSTKSQFEEDRKSPESLENSDFQGFFISGSSDKILYNPQKMGINFINVYTHDEKFIPKFIPMLFKQRGVSNMEKITDMTIRKLTGSRGETQKISIGSGLQLWVTINQGGNTAKTWYMRYYDATGKRQIAKIGEYPTLSLAKAQALAEDMKKKAKEGLTIAQARATEKHAEIEAAQAEQTRRQMTFEAVAEMWLEKKTIEWEARHAKRQRERLTANIFPVFGEKPINDVTMLDIDNALAVIVKREARETAQRICTIIKSIMDYADTMGFLSNAIIIKRLERYRKDMPQPIQKNHLYREMSDHEIGKLLHLIEVYKNRWTFQTSIALQLAPYCLLRPGELCGAEWSEINLDKAEWYIPAVRMKPGKDHVVPLPRQAVKLLLEIRPFSGYNTYVFPSPRTKGSINTNALIKALRRIGYASTREEGESFTTHGFRGMASTALHQKLQYNSDWIELQLSHVDQNRVKTAYNQISPRSYLDERRKMLQAYADYLDELRKKASFAEQGKLPVLELAAQTA